jgi:hypothetical protein
MSNIAPPSSARDLQVSAPDPAKDADQLIDLLCKTFSASEGYWKGERICRNGYLLNSNYDWDISRVGRIGGQLVTHFGVWRFLIRVGHARVLAAGIGSVATNGGYRKKGFLREVANATLDALRESDYDISLLFGIPDFYEQFGYCRAWTWLNATIETARISGSTVRARLEQGRSGARADLAALYNRENGILTGTAVRPAFPLGNPLTESDVYVWKQNKEVAGFVFVGGTGNTLDVRSWAGDPEMILAVTKRLATARLASSVQFQWIHYQSKLARFLRQLNCTFKSDYCSSGGPMIRIASLRRFVTRLRPELENRLRRSYLSAWRGDLFLNNRQEAVTLRIDEGKIQILRGAPSPNSISGGEEIAQLMFGTDEPQQTVDAGRIRLRGQAKVLVPVLFPNQHPALSAWDRF